MDAISTAAGAMSAGMQRLDAIATQVAGVGSLDDANLGQSVAAQISVKTAFEADAKVIEVAERMVGAVLDIRA
jgi:hypothetical protein